MRDPAFQALLATRRPATVQPGKPALVMAGATGTLGNAVLRRLAGTQRFEVVHVLAREPVTSALRGVQTLHAPHDDATLWPTPPADVGVILFDPPRLYHDRERALRTPLPGDLVAVAAWMRRCGACTLAVVLPHAQGQLPEALKRGLASLDEQTVTTLGFERMVFVRSAQKPEAAAVSDRRPTLPEHAGRLVLSMFRYMVPGSEQPVRPARVAELVDVVLQLAPPGIHIAAPELVWRASQQDVRVTVAEWLGS